MEPSPEEGRVEERDLLTNDAWAGFELFHDERIGNAIRATRPFQPGDLVIGERPLILVPALWALPKPLRKLYGRGAAETGAGSVSFLNAHAYALASAPARRALLRCFCSFEQVLGPGWATLHESGGSSSGGAAAAGEAGPPLLREAWAVA
eukprot:SAG22_NODE_8498_length_651_cov_0.922101_1_plen_149_part_10